MDHDLGFLLDGIRKTSSSLAFTDDKLDQYDDVDISQGLENFPKLKDAKNIFIFLKYSPRLKQSSLTIMKKLIKLPSKTCVICN